MSSTSSVSEALHVAAWALLVGGALAACDRHPGEPQALGNPPPLLVPLGPTPGPADPGPVATNPFPHDDVTRQAGRLYFLRYNCAGCHGDHGGGGMGPSLRDREWIYGGDGAQIFDSIAQGRAHGMPAWGVKLPEDVVWKLVAYIRSLRTADEPSPPDQTVPPPPPMP
jgi:cytochrome c oxidase cbb3-type subunit 3